METRPGQCCLPHSGMQIIRRRTPQATHFMQRQGLLMLYIGPIRHPHGMVRCPLVGLRTRAAQHYPLSRSDTSHWSAQPPEGDLHQTPWIIGLAKNLIQGVPGLSWAGAASFLGVAFYICPSSVRDRTPSGPEGRIKCRFFKHKALPYLILLARSK